MSSKLQENKELMGNLVNKDILVIDNNIDYYFETSDTSYYYFYKLYYYNSEGTRFYVGDWVLVDKDTKISFNSVYSNLLHGVRILLSKCTNNNATGLVAFNEDDFICHFNSFKFLYT